MSLYHLMADIGAVPSKVIPKIPANAMKEEDQSIPRICVSRSLDECLTSITVTGITFPFLLEELRTSHTKQIWDKQYQFPFIVRTYCAENNNSAFFDEKKVSKYVWDANFTGECWLTEYREPISTKKRWLVNADIENRHIIRNNESWRYPIIHNSVWSKRRIPPEIIARIEKCKGIFDKMYVVFTDYTHREERRVEAVKREKDPILFGTFQDAATRTIVERFYFIGDWVDEYCDLTLDKMVATVQEKANRDIIKKFSTPESLQELCDQLSNLDDSMNGLYRQREKKPAPKKGFFARVRTAFKALKGDI